MKYAFLITTLIVALYLGLFRNPLSSKNIEFVEPIEGDYELIENTPLCTGQMTLENYDYLENTEGFPFRIYKFYHDGCHYAGSQYQPHLASLNVLIIFGFLGGSYLIISRQRKKRSK